MKQALAAAAALNQTPLDWDGNVAHILEAIRRARKLGARILALPELCITGYGCEDAFHSPGVLEEALTAAQTIARSTRGMLVTVGLPLEVEGALYSAVALLANGAIAGFVCKQHLAGDGIHYEPRWFKPWPQGVAASVRVGDKRVPVGDLLFEADGARIGIEICEDAWVAQRPGISLASRGADIIMNASASPFSFGKHEVRKRIVLEGSRAFGVSYLYTNLLGCEAGRIIYDGGPMVAAHGELLAQGHRLSFSDVEVVAARISISRSRLARRRQASFRPTLCDDLGLVEVPGMRLFSETGAALRPLPQPDWERSPDIKHEEFARAVMLGLFDYMRKSRSEGFVVSLSGGVDSSAATCLVALMVRAALAELGHKGLSGRLPHVPGLARLKEEKAIVKRLLACAYQGSENSSQLTRDAAAAVAREAGAEFCDLDITRQVSGYEELVSKALKVKISWKDHDLARQNIQARARAPSVWLIANLRRALLLSTGNRSEAAVGYATMDGDTSGGLSPLGGIDKAYLREWLLWLERQGPAGLGRFASLKGVNVQAPTAELRPARERQTDEGDLMPYVVLDAIERCAVRDKLLPVEAYRKLASDFAGRYPKRDLAAWVERFFVLWSRNQWKRERYAPSFHLDDENLDPKTWCRFPILSGGYDKELRELRKIARRR